MVSSDSTGPTIRDLVVSQKRHYDGVVVCANSRFHLQHYPYLVDPVCKMDFSRYVCDSGDLCQDLL